MWRRAGEGRAVPQAEQGGEGAGGSREQCNATEPATRAASRLAPAPHMPPVSPPLPRLRPSSPQVHQAGQALEGGGGGQQQRGGERGRGRRRRRADGPTGAPTGQGGHRPPHIMHVFGFGVGQGVGSGLGAALVGPSRSRCVPVAYPSQSLPLPSQPSASKCSDRWRNGRWTWGPLQLALLWCLLQLPVQLPFRSSACPPPGPGPTGGGADAGPPNPARAGGSGCAGAAHHTCGTVPASLACGFTQRPKVQLVEGV